MNGAFVDETSLRRYLFGEIDVEDFEAWFRSSWVVSRLVLGLWPFVRMKLPLGEAFYVLMKLSMKLVLGDLP